MERPSIGPAIVKDDIGGAIVIGHPPLFPSDPVITQEEAAKRLEHVTPILRDCILRAFEILKHMVNCDPLVPRAMEYMFTRQKMMNSLVVESIRQAFAGRDPEIQVREENGFLELRVDDAIDLRFKCVDPTGKSRNAFTDAQKLYRNNLPLVGNETLDVMRLTVGWRWDAAATQIDDVVIAFEKGDLAVWQCSILGEQRQRIVALPRSENAIPSMRVKSASPKEAREKRGG